MGAHAISDLVLNSPHWLCNVHKAALTRERQRCVGVCGGGSASKCSEVMTNQTMSIANGAHSYLPESLYSKRRCLKGILTHHWPAHCTLAQVEPPSWAFNQDEWIACRKVPPTPNNPLHSAPTYRLLHWFHLAATWALVIYTHSRHHLVRLHYMLWRCNCKTIICLKSWLQN